MSIKPVLGSQLLLGHPINQGLIGCWLLNEGGGLVNDLSGNYRPLSVPSGWSWVPEYRGLALAGDASGYMTTSGGFRITGYPFTLSAAFRCTAQNNAESCLISIGQVGFWGNFHEISVVFFTGTPDIAVYNWSYESGSGNQKIECSQTGGGFLRHQVVLVCVSATERQVWLNGVLVGTGTTSVAFNSAIDSIRIGGRASSENADRMISSVHLESAMAWNRALTPFEIWELSQEPFAGIRRDRLTLWVGALAGEGGIVNAMITPNSLGTSLTLQTPRTNYDYKVTPVELSLLLATQTPGAEYDFKVSPDALALLLTGQAPTANYDYKFSSDALALLLTEQTPTARHDFKVALGDALSLALGLQTPDVGTSISVTAYPDAQSLVLSLQSAGVNYDFKFSAGALALALIGQAPTLAYDYKVSLDSALALALSLQYPGVGATINVTVFPGARGFGLTMQTPQVEYDYRVFPGSLGLAVEIQTPILTYDYLIAIAAGLGMTCTLQTPAISGAVGRTYIVCSSTDPAILDLYVGGTLIARFT